MITIGFSTREIDESFIEHIKNTCGPKNIEIIPFENKGTHSLSEAYNIILEKSSNDIVVLCHDDIYFDKKGWGSKLVKHFQKNSNVGIIGVAGSTELPKSSKWWENPNKMKGIVNHEHGGKKWESKYSNSLGNKLDEVVLVDGLFIGVKKDRLKSYFNESIKGFHFYDVVFSLENFNSGVGVSVMYDVRVTHKSIGQTNDEWEKNREQVSTLYKDILPQKIKIKQDSKINVLISSLYFKNFTGSEMYVFELAKELTKLNCNVSILSDIGDPLVKMSKKYGIKCYSTNEPPGFKVGDGVWLLNTPNGPIKTEKGQLYKIFEPPFDIIHTQHKPITEYVCNLYPNTPKIATIHSEVISLEDPIIDDTIIEYVAIRPEIKEKMVNIDGVDESKISVIYNPIDSSRFNTNKTRDDGYVLFVGTIDYLREQSIRDISNYAKEQGKELWLVGDVHSNYLPELLTQTHIKHFESTSRVEKYVKNCSETAGILLGRTTIEGWMCGKPGWIYDVDSNGNIKNKELTTPPEDVDKFKSIETAKKIKQNYVDIINQW